MSYPIEDPRDISDFRNPPWLSPGTPISMVAWAARTFGFGLWLLRTLMTKMLSDAKYHRIFGRYEALPEDVFVAVFSKSGTNWAMQIATEISWKGTGDFAHMHDIVAWPGAPFAGT